MRKLPLLLLVLVVPIFALAACGGGDGEEDEIIETIETSALSNDPADCKELATLRFLEQTEFREGEAALTNCEADAKNPDDDANDVESVEVANVEIDGSEATADVAFSGGTFDGQTFAVAVVEEDGNWKVDEITGFTEFDRETLVKSIESQFEEEGLEPKIVSCVSEEFTSLPRPEFEEVMIGGSPEPIVEIVQGCE